MVSISAPTPQPSGSAVKAAKSTPRRPNLVMKRSSSMAGMDVDGITSVLSPTKRARVQFSQEVEVRTTDEFDKPLDIVREEVSRALANHKRGDSTDFNQIVACFDDESRDPPPADTPTRRKLLLALTGNVGSLNRSCDDLIWKMLDSDWLTQDTGYVELFGRFLLLMISANGSWIGQPLLWLVKKLGSPVDGISRLESQQRVHRLIKSIIQQFPHNGSMSLRNALEEAYPEDWDSTKTHVLYVHNLFTVLEYAPQLQAFILSLITNRLVNLDMQIQTDAQDMEDLDELLAKGPTGDLDSFMDSLEDGDEDLSDDEDETKDEASAKEKAILKDINRLDVLMDITFDYYTRQAAPGPDAQSRVLDLLESHFDNLLLPAYRSRFTQFLLFHFAQGSHELIDRFVGTCLIRAMDKNQTSMVRQSAATYLGSFIARGKHVSAQIVHDAFKFIAEELDDLRQSYEPRCDGPDMFKYGAYYALFQSLIYIFCFRWRDLETPASDSGSPMPTYNSLMLNEVPTRHTFATWIKAAFDQNILSPLNPLKVCSKSIVEEFAKVAHKLEVTYIYPKLEMNHRVRLSAPMSALSRETALSANRDESLLQLGEYFPFDPYRLPRSNRWVEDDYRTYESLPGEDEDEESDSAKEDSDEEDDVDSDSDSD